MNTQQSVDNCLGNLESVKLTVREVAAEVELLKIALQRKELALQDVSSRVPFYEERLTQALREHREMQTLAEKASEEK